MADLDIAGQALADEADILTSLVAQAASGDVNARSLLPGELGNAKSTRAMYVQNVPGLDTTVIDAAIHQATGFLGGSTASGGGTILGMSPLTLGIVAIVGVVAFAAMRRGGR